MMELAIFTTLKPAKGRACENQSRSLENWRAVFGGVNIVRFEGPLVPFKKMVEDVERDCNAEILMYANADILFDKTQMLGLYQSWDNRLPPMLRDGFLLTGQRVDIFEDGSKRLHHPSGMDYFIFKRGLFSDLPKVTMGRAYCDSALVAYCLRRRIPVVDASYAIKAEHQFHDYNHLDGGRSAVWKGDEALENKRVNGLCDFGPNVLDATHTLLPDGRIVPNIRKRPQCWGLWNFLTRGGKWWKNPKWEGVAGI